MDSCKVIHTASRLTADISEAHDIAQEAFCRAWNSWPRLSDFDNPAAWVRRVAVNLALRRHPKHVRRRLRVNALGAQQATLMAIGAKALPPTTPSTRPRARELDST